MDLKNEELIQLKNRIDKQAKIKEEELKDESVDCQIIQI